MATRAICPELSWRNIENFRLSFDLDLLTLNLSSQFTFLHSPALLLRRPKEVKTQIEIVRGSEGDRRRERERERVVYMEMER